MKGRGVAPAKLWIRRESLPRRGEALRASMNHILVPAHTDALVNSRLKKVRVVGCIGFVELSIQRSRVQVPSSPLLKIKRLRWIDNESGSPPGPFGPLIVFRAPVLRGHAGPMLSSAPTAADLVAHPERIADVGPAAVPALLAPARHDHRGARGPHPG